MALGAECAFAWRLAVRNRACLMALALVALGLGAAVAGGALVPVHIVLAGGVLGAIAGSLLLAPGAVLTAARSTAAPWWIAPAGRLLGVVTAIAPVLVLSVAAAGYSGGNWTAALRALSAALPFAIVCAASGMALGTLIGASAAGAVGFVAVWIGGLPPSAMHELLAGVPYLQRPAVLLWNTLPLAWRARAVASGSVRDLLVLAAWIVVCLVLAGWAAGSVFSRDDGRRLPS